MHACHHQCTLQLHEAVCAQERSNKTLAHILSSKFRVLLVEGVPSQPMLARVAESVDSALKILGPGNILAEHKYDGRRAQIHLLPNGQVGRWGVSCQVLSRCCVKV